MEEFLERFKYILQSSSHRDLDKGILKIILLRELREKSLELLNMVGNWDISKEEFNTICDLCVKCLHGPLRHKRGTQALKSSSSGVTKKRNWELIKKFED